MSDHATTTTTTGRKNKSNHEAQEGALGQEAQALASTALASSSPSTVTLTIAEQEVTLPVKFALGHVLTDSQAKILDAAYQRQFTNNQNALFKARVAKRAEGKKVAEPSATDLAALYMDYEPNVGGATRGNTLEALRHATAWRFWTDLVAAHNANIAEGGQGLIAKAPGRPLAITPRPRKVKGEDDAVFNAKAEYFDAERSLFKARLLEHKEYGRKIAALVEAELASRKAEASATKTDSKDVVVADDSLLDD